MVQALVRAHLDRDAGHVQTIDVPRHPRPRRLAVLLGIADQPDRDAAVLRGDDRVGVPAVRDPVHDHVDLLRLLVVAADRAVRVRLERREVQLRVLRVRRVVARERLRHVRVVGVGARVGPQVVELRHEALDEGGLVGEVDGFVDVVHIRREAGEQPGVRAEVRAAELDDVLAGEHHQLVVHDAAGGAVAHRDPGRLQLGQPLGVVGVGRVGPQVHQDPDRHAGLKAPDELGGVARVLHEPEAHVDPDRLVPDVIDKDGAAVFVRGIAQAIERARRGCICAERSNRQRDRDHCPTNPISHIRRPQPIRSTANRWCAVPARCHRAQVSDAARGRFLLGKRSSAAGRTKRTAGLAAQVGNAVGMLGKADPKHRP